MDLTIRLATDADMRAVAVLAAVDSQPAPTGRLLLAEVGGELWAAESVDGRGSIGDPFRPTADVRELLRERARQLVAAEGRAGGRRAGLRWRGRAVASG